MASIARTIPSDTFRVRGPVAVTLALCMMAIGGFAALKACAGPALPADERTALIDGRKVAFRVLGAGRPAVVMVSGLGEGMASFKDVAPDLARDHTVILYDRAGYGASAPTAGPRDAEGASRELSALLAQSSVPGPYVVIGHSLGGTYAEYFAARNPGAVAGLVLEESRPSDFERRCLAARAGMCGPPAMLMRFEPLGAQREFAGLEATMREVAATAPVQGKPVLVLSRAITDRPAAGDAVWRDAQADLAARYPGSAHVTAAEGGHALHKDQPTWFTAQVRTFLAELR